MKRNTIIFAVGAAIAVLIALVAMLTLGPEASPEGVMSWRQAERLVNKLKQKVVVPVDEGTRQKINSLINDLGRVQELIVEVSPGNKQSVAWKAGGDLLRIAQQAVSQLIDAAGSHDDPVVRKGALNTISLHIKNSKLWPGTDVGQLMEYLPVFVRSTYDKDHHVRATAVAKIRSMAMRFYRQNRQEELNEVSPYLVKALADPSVTVQALAARGLYDIGRQAIVPQELIEQHEIGQWE